MGRLNGKVAFITGAARGQGRSHAVRMASEGASIIAVDICAQIPTVFYPMSTEADLAETARLVEETGGRIHVGVADVRDREAMQRVLDAGVKKFGHVDTVLANAGTMPVINEGEHEQAWHDGIAVLLTGVWNTIEVALPHMLRRGQGGSILITSSAAGLTSIGVSTSPGQAAYSAAKHGVVGLMRLYASELAAHNIRVVTVHPGGTATPMIHNDGYAQFVRDFPDVAGGPKFQNPMKRPPMDPAEVSNAMVFLASDEATYVTGITFSVDAGYVNR